MPKKLTLVGQVKDGILAFPLAQLDLRNRWLNSKQTFSVIEILDVPKKLKSPNQLGYIFGAIVETIRRTLDDRGWDICGAPWTESQIMKCLYHQHHVKHDTIKTLSKMDMAEASVFIDSCLQWSAGSPWYCPCPDPRPQAAREQQNDTTE